MTPEPLPAPTTFEPSSVDHPSHPTVIASVSIGSSPGNNSPNPPSHDTLVPPLPTKLSYTHCMVTRSQNNIFKPKCMFSTTKQCERSHEIFSLVSGNG